MIIVVEEHDNGWFSHVVPEGPRPVLSDVFGSVWPGWATHARDQEVADGDHIDGFRITFERYDDPIEDRLLRELDASMLVYADWLDEQGRAAQAEMLRLQLLALDAAPSSPEFSVIDQRLNDLVAELPYGWCCYATRPIIVLGDELTFRIGRHHRDQPSQRTVQIWAAGYDLTPFDDTAYVPQFVSSVSRDRDAVKAAIETPPTTMRLFYYGPTTDDMRCTARFDGDDILLDVDVEIYLAGLGRPRRDDPPHREQFTIRMRTRALVELFDKVIRALAN